MFVSAPSTRPLLFIAITGAASTAVQAQTLPPPQNVVSLSSSATVEVMKDVLNVAFSTTREGTDAALVQSQLKAAVDAALAETRKVARNGQIDVHTGNFSLFPRYAPKGGGITGWQGTAELLVDGKDIVGISQLTGRVSTMSIARVAFGLSREAREKVEADVTARAIADFRSKAEFVSRQFGFGGYSIRELNVSSNEGGQHVVPMMRLQAAKVADEALPVEAGKASVSVSVSGSVQMSPK